MAVVYMKKLELQPEKYQSQFTQVTKGVNLQITEQIADKIESTDSVCKIIEIGCGTGDFSLKMAKNGHEVVAIDINPKMLEFAQAQKINSGSFNDIQDRYKLIHADVLSENFFKELDSHFDDSDSTKFDIVISNFVLSELRPLQQRLFLGKVNSLLSENGTAYISAEFRPKGLSRVPFSIKRWYYKKKMHLEKTGSTQPLRWFENYIQPSGFVIENKNEWSGGSIRLYELKKSSQGPYAYFPKAPKYFGIIGKLREWRCLLTGQIDSVPIEPGIYQSGNPGRKSPVIVTANYSFTFSKVMKDLDGMDAWVLCVDSNGINVWCAARGGDFGNEQLLEAVDATPIKDITDQNELILPQLSAGGVAAPKLPMNSEKFPFTVTYGPVWSKLIPEYIKTNPVPKPEKMKRAKFSFKHRFRALITHFTFLVRKVFLKPIILALLLSIVPFLNPLLDFTLYFLASLLFVNLIIGIFIPLTKSMRSFLKKSYVFGYVSMVAIGFGIIRIYGEFYVGALVFPMAFWLGFFCTMSFSGYTMSTSPREISAEYPRFSKISTWILYVGIPLVIVDIILINAFF